MRGRKAKSEAEHALAGNPGKRTRAKKAAQVFFSDPTLPQPPSWLSARAKEIWAEEIAGLKKTTLLQAPALRLFAMYCAAWHRYERYEEKLAAGDTYETKTGYARKRPEVEMRDASAKEIRSLANDLNISPKSWASTAVQRQAQQLDLFARGLSGTTQPAPADGDTAAPVASPPPKGDKFDAFISRRPH